MAGVLAIFLLAAVPAGTRVVAEPMEVRLPPPGTNGWRALTLPGGKTKSRYTTVRDAAEEVLRAEAKCSASAMYYPVDRPEWMRTPLLSWRWKVADVLPPHAERKKSGDDFAARVYVMFAFDSARASWWGRLRHRAGKALVGGVLPGSAINYVWTTGEDLGRSWKNPYASESEMVSRGKGPLPEWRREEVNIVADYRRLFGHSPPRLIGVAVMTDADDTCTHAVAYYADIAFRAAR